MKVVASRLPPIAPGVIYIDSRVGSREFMPLVKQRLGLRCTLAGLNSADFAFRCGHQTANPFCDGDSGCTIGVERKTLSDMIGSLLKKRIDKQIPDLLEDYTQAWIVVEGIWRPAADDALEVFRGGQWRMERGPLTYSELCGWLARYTIMSRGRILEWRTSSPTETAVWLASIWRWWQKDWKKHQSITVGKMPAPMRALTFRPTTLHKTAASLPEIGIVHMKKAARAFPSILEMVNAPLKDWVKAGFGKKDAATIYTTIRRRYW